jgi:hypothetical protein
MLDFRWSLIPYVLASVGLLTRCDTRSSKLATQTSCAGISASIAVAHSPVVTYFRPLCQIADDQVGSHI